MLFKGTKGGAPFSDLKMTIPLIEKYRPVYIKDVVGNSEAIHQLKSMMGMMQQKMSFEPGSVAQEHDLFSLLDSLETSEEDKERLKSMMEDNPFDILA